MLWSCWSVISTHTIKASYICFTTLCRFWSHKPFGVSTEILFGNAFLCPRIFNAYSNPLSHPPFQKSFSGEIIPTKETVETLCVLFVQKKYIWEVNLITWRQNCEYSWPRNSKNPERDWSRHKLLSIFLL